MSTPHRDEWSGRRLDDADFSYARLHSPNFEGAKITDGWLANADISAFIGGLRINGVMIAPLVTAELDRMFPERILLRAGDPNGLAEAWTLVERVWADTVSLARALPAELLSERIDGEWSFLETLRHLIMATDCWNYRKIRGSEHAYHPWGVTGSFLDAAAIGLDGTANPGLDEILEVRTHRMDAVKATIQGLDAQELERICEPPATAGHPTEAHSVLECLHVVLDEEWEHSRYANRDLEVLLTR
jgi:DinB superfamily